MYKNLIPFPGSASLSRFDFVLTCDRTRSFGGQIRFSPPVFLFFKTLVTWSCEQITSCFSIRKPPFVSWVLFCQFGYFLSCDRSYFLFHQIFRSSIVSYFFRELSLSLSRLIVPLPSTFRSFSGCNLWSFFTLLFLAIEPCF